MAEKITRTICSTEIEYFETIPADNGEANTIKRTSVVPNAVTNNKDAKKALEEVFGEDRSFMVLNFSSKKYRYEMPLADFMQAATKTEIDGATKSVDTVDSAEPEEEEKELDIDGQEETVDVDEP